MKYKVGDKLKSRDSGIEYVITEINNNMFLCIGGEDRLSIAIGAENYVDEMFELIPNYLTTEEFIKEVEKLGLEVERCDNIANYIGNGADIVATVGEKSMFCVNTDCENGDYLEGEYREMLYSILDRYARTPLDKRKPEKRFRLKFPSVKGTYSYNYFKVCDECGWYRCTERYFGDDAIFTESDILRLQEKFPEINFDKMIRIEVTE